MAKRIEHRGGDAYRLSVPNKNGPPFRKTVHCASKAEAENEYVLFKAECLKGQIVDPKKARYTLNQFYDYWKKHYAEVNLAAASLSYNEALSKRVLASLGSLDLQKIKPAHIIYFINQLRAPDASMKDKPLSDTTIRKHYSFLKELLNFAIKWDLLLYNPCDRVDAPKNKRLPKEMPNKEEFASFLDTVMASATVKQKLWVLLAFELGLRREEIFGLQIGDIDFNKKLLYIKRAVVYITGQGIVVTKTKTQSGKRGLEIPPLTFAALQNHIEEATRLVKARAKRKKIVNLYNPTAPDSWLFTQPDNSVAHPHSFNTFLQRFCKDNQLCQISPHTLRHLFGSYLLNAGIDLATVSAILGHKYNSFTANTYIHEVNKVDGRIASTMQNISSNILKTQA